MFKNKYVLVVCFFALVFGCEDDATIHFSETNFTSTNNTLVELNIPVVIENNAVGKSINQSIGNHVISALQIGEQDYATVKSIEESITNFNKEYTAFKNDFPDSTETWEAQIDGEVIFKSPDFTSISLTSYTNTGGAHGVLNISFLNFEISTGKLIDNNELFTDVEAFKTLAQQHFEDALEDKDLRFENDTFQLPKNIGYSDDGIILLYNIYEIAPYISDIIEVNIPFEDAELYLVFNSF